MPILHYTAWIPGICAFLFWWKLRWEETPRSRQDLWLNRHIAEKNQFWTEPSVSPECTQQLSELTRSSATLSASMGTPSTDPAKAVLVPGSTNCTPPHLHPFVIQPIEISNFTPFNSDMSHLIPNKVGCNVPCSRAEPRRGVCVLSPALLSPQLKGRELSWHNRGCASLHTASHSFSNNILSSWRSYS